MRLGWPLALAGVLVIATVGAFAIQEAPAAPEPAAAVAAEPWALSMDLLESLKPGELRLIAFQAPADGTLRVEGESRLKGSGDRCAYEQGLAPMPVEEMLAMAEGAPVTDPPRPGGAGGSGAGMASGVDFVVNGMRAPSFVHPPGSVASGSKLSAGLDLKAGEWYLHAVGGILDVAALTPDSYWRLDVAFPQPMLVLELPPGPLLCGWGFGALEEILVRASVPATVTVQMGGHLEAESPYGMTAHYTTLGQAMGTRDGVLSVGDRDFPLQERQGAEVFSHWGPAKAGFTINEWRATEPLWVIAGIWAPWGT
jgi:hypothetical protein